MPYLVFVAIFALAILGGCANDSGPNTPIHDHGTHDHAVELLELKTPHAQIPLTVPRNVTEQPGWADALREIDTAYFSFCNVYKWEVPLTKIVFESHVHGLEDDGMRARYVGNGTIAACYHERIPHTFCLPEALGDLVRANPTEGVTKEEIQWAVEVSQSWVGAMYGLATPID